MGEMTIDQAVQVAFGHQQAGRLQQAEHIYRQILAVDPRHFDALQLLGLIAQQTGQVQGAIELMSRAVAINGSVGVVHGNLAASLRAAGRLDDAIKQIDEAVRLAPDQSGLHRLRALLLIDVGLLEEAAAAWRRLAELDPASFEAWGNLAATLERLGRMDDAVAAARRSVQINPSYAVGHMNLGAALAKLGRMVEALDAHRHAVSLRPDLAMAWVNVAFDAQTLGLLEEAESASRRAIALNPDEVGAHQNLAAALQDQGRLEEAAESYQTAVRLLDERAATALPAQAQADRDLATALRIVATTLLPPIYDSVAEIDHWRDRVIGGIAELKRRGTRLSVAAEPAPTLFTLAYQGRDDLAVNRDFATLIAAPPITAPSTTTPSPAPSSSISPRGSGGRIRVGFISRFFRNHTIGRLNVGLVEQLDRSRFEVLVFSVGDAQDDVAGQFRAKADRYFALPPMMSVARDTIAAQQLDVLFYADIGMDPITYSLAHSRLARVQCATWGHPVTSGIRTVDYFISSESLETPGSEAQYTERLVKLKSLAVYYQRPTTSSTKTRADFALPHDATLYGCLQMIWKFHPDFDPILGEVLRRDPKGLVLIIAGLAKRWDDRLMERLRRTIPDVADRVRFVPRQSYDDFLALTSVCDVMLDPLHFGGGNTTYEALAFGAAVVTLPSQFLRGRITKALYDSMGMADCIASTPQQYIEIASEIGRDANRRTALREKIRAANGVLFENPAGVRELETFFISALG
jgi:protein O-GlcNAc transferase